MAFSVISVLGLNVVLIFVLTSGTNGSRSSGFYVDNSRDQTEMAGRLGRRERRVMKVIVGLRMGNGYSCIVVDRLCYENDLRFLLFCYNYNVQSQLVLWMS